jgi:hypothetical protein
VLPVALAAEHAEFKEEIEENQAYSAPSAVKKAGWVNHTCRETAEF